MSSFLILVAFGFLTLALLGEINAAQCYRRQAGKPTGEERVRLTNSLTSPTDSRLSQRTFLRPDIPVCRQLPVAKRPPDEGQNRFCTSERLPFTQFNR